MALYSLLVTQETIPMATLLLKHRFKLGSDDVTLHLVFHSKQMGEKWKQWQILFSWAPKSLQMVTAAMKLKDAYSLEGKL